MNTPPPPLRSDELMAQIRAEVQRRKRERQAQAAQPVPVAASTSLYKWGDRLNFSTGGNGTSCLREGWASPETDFVWSAAPSASLDIPVPAPSHDLFLTMNAYAFICPALPAQRVRLRVDRVLLAEWSIGSQKEMAALIFKRHLTNKSSLVLQFEFPQACSPKSVGLNDDGRLLGIALSSLILTPARVA